MKKFTSLRLRNLAGHTGLVKLGLVVLIGLAAGAASAQTNFAAAQVLDTSKTWGSVTNSNANINPTNSSGAPSVAYSPPNAPLWYQWTAPDFFYGQVELDTIGSTNDTVLAVFTGSSVTTLSQVAANDDIYAYGQMNFSPVFVYVTNSPNIYNTGIVIPPGLTTPTNPFAFYGLWSYNQPFAGPSGLRFNATAGTTYYFAVDTKNGAAGRVVLNWAEHSSGVFRFATEGVDYGYWRATQLGLTNKSMLLYQCAESESLPVYGENGNIDANTVENTYYHYNNPGLLVTITRVAGSSGRVSVDYMTVDGSSITTTTNTGDMPAKTGIDYVGVSGRLFFDDFEMSKTILIQMIDDATGYYPRTGGGAKPNRDFMIILTNAQYDPFEATNSLSPPRVDPAFGQAMVRILDGDIDPKGPVTDIVLRTNGFTGCPTNCQPILVTNYPVNCTTTNAILNFQKAHYRVGRDESNHWNGTPVTIYVNRTGTNTGATTAMWRINSYFGDETVSGFDQQNMFFPLQPASDYAMPDPPNANGLVMGVIPPDSPDFTNSSGFFGTLNWGDKDFKPKAIKFTVYDNGLTEFNKDLSIQLYRPNKDHPEVADPLGMIAETTVTILLNDLNPPPGSVDELYDADYSFRMKLPVSKLPITTIQDNPHPGTDGEVFGLAVLPNNETVIVGNFTTYNTVGRNHIALLDLNGMLDTTFMNGPLYSGANFSINAVALASGKYVIGGSFTSFNGQPCNRIARLNANGSLDGAFLTGSSYGADGAVRAIAVQPDGKVLVGGDFTHVNGTVRNHLARLNANGTLDTTFNPTNFDDSVYALALQPSGGGQIFVGGSFMNVGGWGYDGIALVNSNGTLNTSFDPGTGPDNTVFALCWQPNGQVLLGGNFLDINGSSLSGIARLNTNGSIDTAGFSPGMGADDMVKSIIYVTNVITSYVVVTNPVTAVVSTNTVPHLSNGIYIGGKFKSFNGTRRLGFARLYPNGTLDTTFMDTAFNQFAGLTRIYFKDQPGMVDACGVQSDGNVIIGGSFDEVGGGQADAIIRNTNCAARGIPLSFGDPNLLVSENQQGIEPKTRDGVRNRNNVARLIGGSINGVSSLTSPVNAYAPGNIGLLFDSYSANETDPSRNVELVRVNGGLGPAGANFAIQPGLAQSGVDYVYNANEPLYWIAWENTMSYTRMHGHGFFGTNGMVEDIYGRFFWGNALANLTAAQITIHPNPTIRGNLNAQFQLANPAGADLFYLGGQNIPLGVALGSSAAQFTLFDNTKHSGQFGFTTTNFIASASPAAISVVRSNGTYGGYSVTCTTGNGTAASGLDYTALNQSKYFDDGVLETNVFNVTIQDNGVKYTNRVEKTVLLHLSGLDGPVDGNGTYGISNAVLRLINPHYKGYLSFSATNYIGNESAGFITFVVNRTVGSMGALSVLYATTNGTAFNGVDYIGATNLLSWADGDISPRIVNVLITNTYTVGAGKYFVVSLRNPTNNGVADPALMGFYTNATLTISNDNSYGTIQFSAPSYPVNENGGYATITAIRSGGGAGSVSVGFATANGPYAFYNTNYVATNGTLTFTNTQTASSFNVRLLDDGRTNNPNFYFNVNLTNAVNATLGSLSNAIVAILDAEGYDRPPGSPASGPGTNSISEANDSVLALALQSNNAILVGGKFTQINSTPENYLARLNADGSLDTAFPNVLSGPAGPNGPVNALVCQSDGRIVAGGNFTTMNGVYLSYFARLMTDGSLDTSFNPGAGADGVVNALAETFIGGMRKIYVAGAFNYIYDWSTAHPAIARLNDDGTLDASFATGLGADGAVYAIAVYPTNSIFAGKVLIGGAFTHYNGTNLNYIARLNADGSVDTTFTNATANGAVNAIAIQPDGRVLVGGSFFQFNGVSMNRIARLNADGSLDTGFRNAIGGDAFNGGVNNTVAGIALQPDNRIVLVGQFTQAHGLNCNRIVRLLPTGSLDNSINFGAGANSDVNAVLVQPWDGLIILGGAFTQFNNQPHDHLVRLYGGAVGDWGSLILPAGSTLEYESFTPHNSIIDPGETVVLSFAFTNSAGNNVTNLVATLLLTNGITSPSGPQTNYGVLIVGGPSVSLPFYFTATNGANGQPIAATFQLQSGTNNLGLAVFSYTLGILTNTFANTNAIIINDFSPAPAPYPAAPYPSIINVSGVGGSLLKVTVTFAKLTHTWPADIDALLESPSLQNALLMANAGGGYALHGVTLAFDADASAYLPQAAQIVSGACKPTAYFPIASFLAPAPSAPYATNLSSLYGGNPNGDWSLFIIDDAAINSGVITNGWSLNVITASPIAPQPLQIGSMVYSNGIFHLTITGPLYSTVIKASTNLINWVPIYTNPVNWMLDYTNLTSSFTFTDPKASNYPTRFYIAVPLP